MNPAIENLSRSEKEKALTWIAPKFVGEVEFKEWTSSGKRRHPRFMGLRKEKQAEDVTREDKRAVAK